MNFKVILHNFSYNWPLPVSGWHTFSASPRYLSSHFGGSDTSEHGAPEKSFLELFRKIFKNLPSGWLFSLTKSLIQLLPNAIGELTSFPSRFIKSFSWSMSKSPQSPQTLSFHLQSKVIATLFLPLNTTFTPVVVSKCITPLGLSSLTVNLFLGSAYSKCPWYLPWKGWNLPLRKNWSPFSDLCDWNDMATWFGLSNNRMYTFFT